MRKTNKKLHAWAKAENVKVWELTHGKTFWQNPNESNATYKITSDFMVVFNGFITLEKSAFKMYDNSLKLPVFVTAHGVLYKGNENGDWQRIHR